MSSDKDLALPFRIVEILPALRLVLRLDQARIDQDSHRLHVGGNADLGGLERGAQVLDVGNGADGLDVVAGLALFLDHRGGDDLGIAQKTARGLLGPDPLGEFAGAQIEAFHLDAVFGFERFQNRQIIRRPQRHAVDDDLALFLGGGDDGIPAGVLRRRRECEAGKKTAKPDRQCGTLQFHQHVCSPLILFLCSRPL